MAFDKQELKQLKDLFLNQRKEIMGDTHSLIDQEHASMRSLLEEQLRPIKEEIAEIKQRLNRLFDMVHEDIHAAFVEIEDVKKRITKLEHQVATLER